jgi:DNA-binding transcriptional MerR regulator
MYILGGTVDADVYDLYPNAITAASMIEIHSGVRSARGPRRPSEAKRRLAKRRASRRLTLDWQVWVAGRKTTRRATIGSVMSPEKGALGEQVFHSADVARIAGISLRQLQWWDERKLVSARIDDHRRIYTPEQVLEILTVAALRRKGLSLQRIRKVLRLLRRELERQGNRLLAEKSKLYLITDGNSVFTDDQPEGVLNRIAEAKHPTYLVCLTDQMRRITSEKSPRRYRTRQLQLF